MVKVGITGGIGSGKSTVTRVWQSLGAFVINADNLAKDLMTNSIPVKSAIRQVFGQGAYKEDGSLNRAYLAEEAFEKGRVGELNAIVHPHIPGEVELLMQNADKQGYEVLVYEAALLLQNKRPDFLDYIVLVLADRTRRLQWVQNRDQADYSQVMNRINSQQNFEELTHLADIIIRNDGSLEALKTKALKVYQQFVK